MSNRRLQPPPGPLSFTTKYNGRSNQLKTEVGISAAFNPEIAPKHIPESKYVAIWDTGATHTSISPKVVAECELRPTGMLQVDTASATQELESYLISVYLPNRVVVPQVRVAQVPNLIDADVLIGMDIIGNGDFAVTNHNGSTAFSFRLPSCECIDFVAQPASKQKVNPTDRVGRNDPCPCGSGLKYKQCCMPKNNRH